MNYINFLQVSFCLLLNVSVLYSSEAEDITSDWSNPLTKETTYLDEHEKFTLAKANKAIEESDKDLVNHPPERSCCRPLEWLCASASTSQFNEKNRLNLATFLLKGASHETIERAHFFCQNTKHSPTLAANQKIMELLNSVIEQKKIETEPEEIAKKESVTTTSSKRYQNNIISMGTTFDKYANLRPLPSHDSSCSPDGLLLELIVANSGGVIWPNDPRRRRPISTKKKENRTDDE